MDQPDAEVIALVHEAHIVEQRQLPRSTTERELGAEQAMVREYAGRIVFELLQNAMDRANDRIIILAGEHEGRRTLVVGNDGEVVSVYPREEDARRSDFHALCSLHTSNKTAAESIGNKGIGFRSVFSAAPAVRVYSSWMEGGEQRWWSLEMTHPTRVDTLSAALPDREVAAEKLRGQGGVAPSFYYPGMRIEQGELPFDREGLKTVVFIDGIRDDAAWRDILETSQQLAVAPLFWLATRSQAPNRLAIRLQCPAHDLGAEVTPAVDTCCSLRHEGWAVAPREWNTRSGWPQTTDLLVMAQDVGLELNAIEVAVAVDLREAPLPGLYYSYLPTEQDAGFGAHIHADFYLSNSRKAVAFQGNSGPAAFNQLLLDRAADLIVEDLWRREEVVRHPAFWRHANPQHSSDAPLKRRVFDRFFLRDDWRSRWSALVALSFSPRVEGEAPRPLSTYHDFWDAVNGWAETAYRLVGWTWYRTRLDLIGSVRGRADCLVLPICLPGDLPETPATHAVAVPADSKASGRRGQVVFLRSEVDEDTQFEILELPACQREQGLVVTAFQPRSVPEKEARLTAFTAAEALQALRTNGLEEDPESAAEVLSWIVRVVAMPSERKDGRSLADGARITELGAAWGMLSEIDDYRRLARVRLLDVPVPTRGGRWRASRAVFAPLQQSMASAELLVAQVPSLALLDEPELVRRLGRDGAALAVKLLGIPPCPRLVPEGTGQERTFRLSLDAEALNNDGRRGLVALLDDAAESYTSRLPNDVVAGVRRQVWNVPLLPAESIKVPQGWPIDPRDPLIAPRDLWLSTARGFRTKLLPHIAEASDGANLPRVLTARFLGASLIGEKTDSAKALCGIESLRDLHATEDHCGKPALVEVYRKLFSLLNDQDRFAAPVLFERVAGRTEGGGLGWATAASQRIGQASVYVVRKPGLRGLLSAFPGLQVSVLRDSEAPKELALIPFDPAITPMPADGGEEDRSTKTALGQHLGALLAIADTTRTVFEKEQVRLRWQALRLRRVADAWLELSLGALSGDRIGKDSLEDALWNPDRKEILLDTVALAPIGPALSEALLGDRSIAIQAERYLAAVDASRGSPAESADGRSRVLRLLGVAQSEVDAWSEEVRSWLMPQEFCDDFDQAIYEALTRFGEVRQGASLTRVGPQTFAEFHQPEATESELRDALEQAACRILEDGGRFAPSVSIIAPNRALWDAARQRQRVSTFAFRVQHQSPDNWTDELRELWMAEWEVFEPALDRLGFTAERARSEFARQETLERGPRWADSIAWARGAVPLNLAPVVRLSKAKPAATPTNKALTPEDEQKRGEKADRQSARGASAEAGVVQLELPGVEALCKTKPEACHRALAAALPHRSDLTPEIFTDAPEWMHVSRSWGNAGFDILTLRDVDGAVEPLRIEVKRASPTHPVIHLSENERYRASQYISDKCLGSYALWVVLGPNRIVDATDAVLELLRGQGAVDCASLLGLGFQPEGYEIELMLEA